MSQESPGSNPFESPQSNEAAQGGGAQAESGDLTTVDWLLVIFCAGIACIIGIIRLIQGKPSAAKMIGFSILSSVLWNIVGAMIQAALERQ